MNCNANMASSTQIVKAPAVGKDSSVVLNIHWASEAGLIHLVNVFGASKRPKSCTFQTVVFYLWKWKNSKDVDIMVLFRLTGKVALTVIAWNTLTVYKENEDSIRNHFSLPKESLCPWCWKPSRFLLGSTYTLLPALLLLDLYTYIYTVLEESLLNIYWLLLLSR